MHPAPPFPRLPRHVQPVRAMAIAVVVLLGVTTLIDLLALVGTVERLSLLSRIVDAPYTVDVDALRANDDWYAFFGLTRSGVYALTGITFLIWLTKARSNAEALTAIEHRRDSQWVVLGWLLPVVNLWFPKQVVDDIWATSKPGHLPANPPHPATLRNAPRSWLVRAWWLTWLFSTWVSLVVHQLTSRGEGPVSLLLTARAELFFAAPNAICAVLASLVVLRITRFQEHRHPSLAPAS
ncbi:DUF4328 domain-containing protein [Streptosporangium sp. NPDC002721]|uniref:DUF4328 domain-containing protein n=1 Tax=Streptosporangium sp. NPDC002721 TaxID=3366188 RepID=UPI0036C2F76C